MFWKAHNRLPKEGHDIHHKDEDHHNNALNNLEEIKHKDHVKKHPQQGKPDNMLICLGCGITFHKRKPHSKYPYHSRGCYKKNYKVSIVRKSKINDGKSICASCGMKKGIEEFVKDIHSKDGIRNKCKNCWKQYINKIRRCSGSLTG